jgi:DNA-binding NarL/FixJ family response regulator
MDPLNILVAEDGYLLRAGITALLAEVEGFRVVAECATYDELLAGVEMHQPDVVLTDIRMPPTFTDEGIRAAGVLREQAPDLGVVVLSQYVDGEYALALVEQGSSGRAYLLKERLADLDQLVSAVRTVVDGGSVIDPLVVEALLNRRAASDPLSRLTPREREVLEHVARGGSNAAIATALFVTERAVEKHINSIFAKLELPVTTDVHRRVAAVLVYLTSSADHSKTVRPQAAPLIGDRLGSPSAEPGPAGSARGGNTMGFGR